MSSIQGILFWADAVVTSLSKPLLRSDTCRNLVLLRESFRNTTPNLLPSITQEAETLHTRVWSMRWGSSSHVFEIANYSCTDRTWYVTDVPLLFFHPCLFFQTDVLPSLPILSPVPS